MRAIPPAGSPGGLADRKIAGVTGYRRPSHRKGMLRKSAFTYDRDADLYRCPEGQALTYRTTDRKGYRHYRSDPAQCAHCPLLASCTSNPKSIKTVTRHLWQGYWEEMDRNRLTQWGKRIYKRRKETVERSFCRRQTTAWPSLCQVPGPGQGPRTGPDGGGGTEYQENRHDPGPNPAFMDQIARKRGNGRTDNTIRPVWKLLILHT